MFFRKPVRLGQVYRAVDDVKTLGMVILKAAGSGGFYCTIPKGTKVVIAGNPWPWPISKGCYVMPLNYRELENIIVPLEERKSPIYNMYTLTLDFGDIKRHFIREDTSEIKFDDERAQKHWEFYFEERFRQSKRTGKEQ